MVKKLPAKAGDTGSIPDVGRSRMSKDDKAREAHLLTPAPPDAPLRSRRSHCTESPWTETGEKPELGNRPKIK